MKSADVWAALFYTKGNTAQLTANASAAGSAMPAAARLPFMIAELAVFAAVSGLFTKKISSNGLWAFPAVISAQIAGRAAFMGLIALTQSITPFTHAMIWAQIQTGFIGLAVQAVLVPGIIILLRKFMIKDGAND